MNQAILNPSSLGLVLNDGHLGEHMKVVGKSRDTKDETWQQPWGECRDILNQYNELTMNTWMIVVEEMD